MKQYTNEQQTAKLIELGLPKPRYYSTDKYTIIHTGFDIINYSIGELIEMLPPIIDEYSSKVISGGGMWSVHYKRIFESRYDTHAKELIDALYAMILQLKEEGVI